MTQRKGNTNLEISCGVPLAITAGFWPFPYYLRTIFLLIKLRWRSISNTREGQKVPAIIIFPFVCANLGKGSSVCIKYLTSLYFWYFQRLIYYKCPMFVYFDISNLHISNHSLSCIWHKMFNVVKWNYTCI